MSLVEEWVFGFRGAFVGRGSGVTAKRKNAAVRRGVARRTVGVRLSAAAAWPICKFSVAFSGVSIFFFAFSAAFSPLSYEFSTTGVAFSVQLSTCGPPEFWHNLIERQKSQVLNTTLNST